MLPEEIQNFKDWKVPLPTRDSHGSDSPDNPISSQLTKLQPRNYRQEGNKLIADTDFGELVNFLPTNLILTGTDKAGLPTFKQV